MCLSHCLDDECLRAIHTGRVDCASMTEIESHLQSCPSCSDRLNALWNHAERGKPVEFLSVPCSTPRWVNDWLTRGAPVLSPKLKPAVREGDIGRLGKYRLLYQLGEGASSVVYHGLDMILNRHVTLKVFRPGYGHGRRRKSPVRTEAKAIASIDSDLVVRIIDIGRDGPTRFLVHPFTDGQNLHQFLASVRGSLDRSESLRLAREITLGLFSVHDSGLCHGDLKPSNILIHRDSHGELHSRLIDLGLAGRKANGAGTKGYMAPEVERGGKPSMAADAYALGQVLGELRAASREPWPSGLARVVEALVDPDPARRPLPRRVVGFWESESLPRPGYLSMGLLSVMSLVAAVTGYFIYRLILN